MPSDTKCYACDGSGRRPADPTGPLTDDEIEEFFTGDDALWPEGDSATIRRLWEMNERLAAEVPVARGLLAEALDALDESFPECGDDIEELADWGLRVETLKAKARALREGSGS